MSNKRFLLIDCNNFFVSCERVFNPKLTNKPVVVLSSNDACIIARSNEAKKLGIKMGEPFFMCKELLKRHNVTVCSSNFTLYSDMSRRVMQTIALYAPQLEVYSIDEAFIYVQLPETSNNDAFFMQYAHMLKRKIAQHVGLPVSIGIAPTKTLAKMANQIAKNDSQYHGVVDISHDVQLDSLLQQLPIRDIWGIGRRFAKKLNSYGIYTALQLTQKEDAWIRKHLTIQGLKTVWELRGIPCIELHDIVEPQHSISVSRAFGKNVTTLEELQQAASCHVTTALERLRAQQSKAKAITVFVMWREYNEPRPLHNAYTKELLASDYTPDFITAAHECLKKMYKAGILYKKVGVLIADFIPADAVQMHSFIALPDIAKQTGVMKAIDTINHALGKNKVFFASNGVKQEWQPKKNLKSPAYTTNWREILTITI